MPPAFGVDLCQGSGQLFTAVTAAGAEDVACKAFRMDAAQEVLAVADFAFDQSDVMFARQVVDVAVDLEIAPYFVGILATASRMTCLSWRRQ